jgi:DNA polymerase III delta prime subunit
MALANLWTEMYRPNTIEGYVFQNANNRTQVESWIKEGIIPHLLLSGAAGIGKTTLAKILINTLEVQQYDVLEVNASRFTGVDDVRDKIISFVSTMPFGEFKVVLLDEADYLSLNAQAALRSVMETYAETARFILTCNYPNKVIPALHSRCQGFHLDKIDHTEFTARAATVLVTEEIEFDLDVLDSYVKATYPDLRKCLNLLQMNSSTKTLVRPSDSDSSTADYKLTMVELFKSGKFKEARELLCSQVRPEEMDGLYEWMYNNLELWSSTDEGQDNAIKVISNYLTNHALCAIAEINLSACLIDLAKVND